MVRQRMHAGIGTAVDPEGTGVRVIPPETAIVTSFSVQRRRVSGTPFSKPNISFCKLRLWVNKRGVSIKIKGARGKCAPLYLKD